MKKIGYVFVLSVLAPSLILAWLAVRSVRDQQYLIERQQSLLFQAVADQKAREIQDALMGYQADFALRTAAILSNQASASAARSFDDLVRTQWPPAEVGFVVTTAGEILSPAPFGRPEARAFSTDNSRFLANRESVEVYLNTKQLANNAMLFNSDNSAEAAGPGKRETEQTVQKTLVPRSVIPQRQQAQRVAQDQQERSYSKLASSEAEFRQLAGESREGMLARFVDNKLNLMVWTRPPADPELIFGAKLSLAKVVAGLVPVVAELELPLRNEVCLALLDDKGKPVAMSEPGFVANWKRPFVATEIGESLPHWEIAVYLLNPARLGQAANTLKLVLSMVIASLLLAIGVGGWLIVSDTNRQLRLARQKTDFVSNVSHELKTPLTSIRMFAELLAEGRVEDLEKRRTYLGIITAETARLTRLINNVLDFARMERGETKLRMQPCNLVQVVEETVEQYRPHLEADRFRIKLEKDVTPMEIRGDRDSLAQMLVNLLSNAEKYSGDQKEITVRVSRDPIGDARSAPLPYARVEVLDRGPGIPKGYEEKVFEKFYRLHDSLSNGIQGSGLGLTLARQIARAHGGDLEYRPREGGGSRFIVSLPLQLS